MGGESCSVPQVYTWCQRQLIWIGESTRRHVPYDDHDPCAFRSIGPLGMVGHLAPRHEAGQKKEARWVVIVFGRKMNRWISQGCAACECGVIWRNLTRGCITAIISQLH